MHSGFWKKVFCVEFNRKKGEGGGGQQDWVTDSVIPAMTASRGLCHRKNKRIIVWRLFVQIKSFLQSGVFSITT